MEGRARVSVRKYENSVVCVCLHCFHAGADRQVPSWLEVLPKGCLWQLNPHEPGLRISLLSNKKPVQGKVSGSA